MDLQQISRPLTFRSYICVSSYDTCEKKQQHHRKIISINFLHGRLNIIYPATPCGSSEGIYNICFVCLVYVTRFLVLWYKYIHVLLYYGTCEPNQPQKSITIALSRNGSCIHHILQRPVAVVRQINALRQLNYNMFLERL